MSAVSPADEARRWLAFARDDLAAAEHAVTTGQIAPRIGCYLAQQAGEKAIKAALIFLQIRFPFIHALDVLRDLLPSSWTVKQEHPDLRPLSQWAIEARYPGGWHDATPADADAAARRARALWTTMLDDLEAHGLDVKDFR